MQLFSLCVAFSLVSCYRETSCCSCRWGGLVAHVPPYCHCCCGGFVTLVPRSVSCRCGGLPATSQCHGPQWCRESVTHLTCFYYCCGEFVAVTSRLGPCPHNAPSSSFVLVSSFCAFSSLAHSQLPQRQCPYHKRRVPISFSQSHCSKLFPPLSRAPLQP
jgi:hypothetical protein